MTSLLRNLCLLRQSAYQLLLCRVTIDQAVSTRCSATKFLTRYSTTNVTDDPPSCEPKTEEQINRKLSLIKLEMASLKDSGARIPDLIRQIDYDELIKLDSVSARRKHYNFLFLKEKMRENDKIQKELKRKSYLAFKEQTGHSEDPHITYGLQKSTMFLRIHDKAMDHWRNNRLRRAMQFGDKIVFDCSYDQYMNNKEAGLAARQLMYTFAENRKHKEPFDLHFCNVNFNGDTFTKLQRFMPTLQSKSFPLNIHEGSYLDLFPKERLVYLTPHCRNDLTEYDPDAIYIVGAMVDMRNHEPLSLMKAKELNLKMARLPLDRYLNWGTSGGKSLTLDQMMKIMLGIKTSRNWETALAHVPRRKIVNEERDQHKVVTKWNANLSKFNKSFRHQENNFGNASHSLRDEQSKVSTAEKFKRKTGTDNKPATTFGRNVRTENADD